MVRNRRRWTTSDIPPQTGRRALVTGANSGIGFHTALELARKGAEIIMPARTQAKAEEAIRRIRKEVPAAKLIPDILDLVDLGSVHAFAERFLKRFASASLDLLINNAVVYALGTRQVTADGFERQFATNYIGPFALTALLFPSIKRTQGSRVVTVASIYSKSGRMDFDNLQSERSYRPVYGAYAMSKLADLVFGLELQNLLTMGNSPVASICAHPGYSITNIKNSTPLYIRFLDALSQPFLAQSAAQGALPTLFAAAAPTAQAGGFYGPDGFLETKGYPAPAKIPARAHDRTVAQQLWKESERLAGVSFAL
jgi:NAD(P)-dependent dehydrogenase (short-subunit alcohol dehydrogenase family)